MTAYTGTPAGVPLYLVVTAAGYTGLAAHADLAAAKRMHGAHVVRHGRPQTIVRRARLADVHLVALTEHRNRRLAEAGA